MLGRINKTQRILRICLRFGEIKSIDALKSSVQKNTSPRLKGFGREIFHANCKTKKYYKNL